MGRLPQRDPGEPGCRGPKAGVPECPPEGMAALYDRIVNGIGERIRDDAFAIFSILAAAARPLSEPEMGIILDMGNSSRTVVRSTDIETFPDWTRSWSRTSRISSLYKTTTESRLYIFRSRNISNVGRTSRTCYCQGAARLHGRA